MEELEKFLISRIADSNFFSKVFVYDEIMEYGEKIKIYAFLCEGDVFKAEDALQSLYLECLKKFDFLIDNYDFEILDPELVSSEVLNYEEIYLNKNISLSI